MLILKTECLKSLSFPNMDQREVLVEDAATKTCAWLLNHGEYKTWLGQRHALLFIVGKPGAGKSTSIRYALQDASYNTEVVTCFFFFGRGNDPQKNSCGLFRSLLHQLLDQIPEMLSDFIPTYRKKRQKSESDIDWLETELREILEQWILSASRDRPIRLYVDALDEAGEHVAEKLIAYFEKLIERLGPTKAGFAVCFSCRHHPVLVPKNVLKICVEEENDQDIATYVRQRLMKYQLSDPAEAQELEQEIIGKASGIFQWVVLIIPIIIEADENGANVKKIRQKIEEIPGELGGLYGHILSKIQDQKRAAQLMQWLCFSLWPLSLEELRYAMVVDLTNDLTSLEECHGSVDFAETDEQMKRLVKSLSGGLAEIIENEERQTVRFIHQTVNDYLIERGLQKLDPSFLDDVNRYLSKSGLPNFPSDNVVSLAHFRISRSCGKYMALKEILEEAKRLDLRKHVDTIERQRNELNSRFPFLEYSAEWTSHAEIVEKQQICQADLLPLFRWPSEDAIRPWWHYVYPRDVTGLNPQAGTLWFIASLYGLLSVIETILESDESFDLDSKDDGGYTALSRAAQVGQVAVVQSLIERGAEIESKNSWGRTPLSEAAGCGHEAVVQLLIERDDVDIESTDADGRTPLSWAARYGHEVTVRLLIERNANIESRDADGRTPLSWAARYGHEVIVRLLIQRGANIASEGRRGATPLPWAAMHGHEAMIQSSIEQEVESNSKNGLGRTRLSWTEKEGYEAIVRLLIEREDIDIDSKNRWGKTPSSRVATNGHKVIV